MFLLAPKEPLGNLCVCPWLSVSSPFFLASDLAWVLGEARRGAGVGLTLGKGFTQADSVGNGWGVPRAAKWLRYSVLNPYILPPTNCSLPPVESLGGIYA